MKFLNFNFPCPLLFEGGREINKKAIRKYFIRVCRCVGVFRGGYLALERSGAS